MPAEIITPTELETGNLQNELNKIKLMLIMAYLKSGYSDGAKSCLLDLVEEVWEKAGSMPEEEIKRRHQQCLTM